MDLITTFLSNFQILISTMISHLFQFQQVLFARDNSSPLMSSNPVINPEPNQDDLLHEFPPVERSYDSCIQLSYLDKPVKVSFE